MSRRFATGLLALALAALGGCSKETVDKPPPPDMTDALRQLDEPTGVFGLETATSVKPAIDETMQGVAGTGFEPMLLGELKGGLAQGGSSEPKSIEAVRPTSFEDEGFGRLSRICNGWGGEATPDRAANGALQLTFSFTDLKIDPIIWGSADGCRMLVGGRRLLLDRASPDGPPTLRVHLGGQLSPADIGSLPVVIALSARVQLDDASTRGDIVVRLAPDAGTFEVVVPFSGGTVVAGISSQAVVSVRARNGTFSCDPGGCTGQAGERIPW